MIQTYPEAMTLLFVCRQGARRKASATPISLRGAGCSALMGMRPGGL